MPDQNLIDNPARTSFINYLESCKWTPYFWGGDDPILGFDCSGFIVEGLKGVGEIQELSDYTADGLFNKYATNEVPEPYAGCLVFWFNSEDRAIHIGAAIDETFFIHAGGGGRPKFNLYTAIQNSPFLKEFYADVPDETRIQQLLQKDIFLQVINQQLYLQQAARQNAFIKMRNYNKYCSFRYEKYGHKSRIVDPFLNYN